MKNVFLVPTDKPSRLFYDINLQLLEEPYLMKYPQNIYITSDELPKLDEWGINIKNNVIYKDKGFVPTGYEKVYCRKIIFATDRDLIDEGIQALTDEQIMEYIKNPVDYVEVVKEVQAFDGLNRPIANAVLFDDYTKDVYSVSFSPKKITTKIIKYSTLLSEFETMEGITSDIFDEKDWLRFDRFKESRENEYSEVQKESLKANKEFVEKTDREDLNKLMSEFDNMYTDKDMIDFADFVYKHRFESEKEFWKDTKELLNKFKKK